MLETTEKGYVMVPRQLIHDIIRECPEAAGEQEAFLRVLLYANYKESVYRRNGAEYVCARGESLFSYMQRGQDGEMFRVAVLAKFGVKLRIKSQQSAESACGRSGVFTRTISHSDVGYRMTSEQHPVIIRVFHIMFIFLKNGCKGIQKSQT